MDCFNIRSNVMLKQSNKLLGIFSLGEGMSLLFRGGFGLNCFWVVGFFVCLFFFFRLLDHVVSCNLAHSLVKEIVMLFI